MKCNARSLKALASIPKAKSVNQSFHTSAECAFLYAGLHTFVALQVNVTENNRILRDVIAYMEAVFFYT